ncbi:FabD/lysophospholipase-like protein, partial [Rhodotorula sp. JG-1b]
LPDLSGTVAKWKDSLASVSSAFSSLQTELSLGPDSTYARILADAHNPKVHPEVQWDAEVRLGRDLPYTERAFLRNRRERIRVAFAELVGVPLDQVDERDLPVVAVAASGGGYRAMINTTASLVAAKESGLFDVVTYMSAVSGSCWALNTLYSVGGGDLDWTLRHLRERVKEPFLAPETFVKLFAIDDEASRLLLSAAILKRASRGGELSLPDVYGTLVSSRLYLSDDDENPASRKEGGPAAPRPLSLATLKTSTQRQYMDDGSHPLPIYTTVRHDLPSPEELAEAEKKAQEGGGPAADSEGEGGGGTEPVAAKLSWTWFETTPYEVGSDKLGAFIPTWSLGRVFEKGKSTERVPELGIPVLSGIYASAFVASLFSYFLEIKPLLVTLPFFSAIDEFVKSNAHKLDAIHPFPPAELPNFLYGLEPSLPTPSSPSDGSPSSSSATPAPSTIPHALTEARTLGFADAGVELNLPYVPLLRRSVDVIIALDSSADSHDVWFTRAAEYAKTSGGAGAGAQDEERGGVRLKNPKPTPLGSAPESKEKAARGEGLDQSNNKAAAQGKFTTPPSSSGDGDTTKPMPESQTKEPPLGKCSVWIGSTKAEDAATCRNDHPTVEDVVRRDGIALAYIPLSPDDEFKNPLEVFSTWKFDYTEDETDRLIRLAKDNFNAGEQQLKTLLKGVWLRKKQQRLR